jgi:hypothetical protein
MLGATYRASKDIEDRIIAREAEMSHQAELKGVEEYAIECSILKVAVSKMFKTVQMKEFKFFGRDSLKTPNGECLEMLVSLYEGTNEINRMLSVRMLIKKQ